MNTKTFFSLLAAVSLCVVIPARAQETAGEKASEAWDATKKTTKKAAKAVATTTKETAKKVENAVTKPSGPVQTVDVNIATNTIVLPSNLSAGRFLFSIKNNTDKPHKIAFEGGALKDIVVDVSPNRTGTVEMTLTPGTYKVSCTVADHSGKELGSKVTVK